MSLARQATLTRNCMSQDCWSLADATVLSRSELRSSSSSRAFSNVMLMCILSIPSSCQSRPLNVTYLLCAAESKRTRVEHPSARKKCGRLLASLR